MVGGGVVILALDQVIGDVGNRDAEKLHLLAVLHGVAHHPHRGMVLNRGQVTLAGPLHLHVGWYLEVDDHVVDLQNAQSTVTVFFVVILTQKIVSEFVVKGPPLGDCDLPLGPSPMLLWKSPCGGIGQVPQVDPRCVGHDIGRLTVQSGEQSFLVCNHRESP